MTNKKLTFIIALEYKKGDIMSKDLVWSKTLLTSYRYLERISEAVDKIVKRTAMSGAHVTMQNYYYSNVFSISEKIINLSERKVTLINLKLLIEDILKSMNASDARILIARHIDGTKRRVLAEKQGVSIRTVFRQIEKAEKAFNKHLLYKGYDDEKLKNWLASEKWILGIYDRLAKTDEEEIVLSRCYIEKAASM